MKHLLSIVLLASTLLPLSCSPPYAPDTREIYNSREPSDIDQVALAKKAWDILGNPSRKKEWPGALNQYNHAVFTLLERGRKLNEHSGDRIQAPSGAFAVETSALGNDRDYRTYEDVIPCSKIQTSFHLEERVTVEGLGIPLAGIVKRNKNAVKRQNESLKDSGNIHTLTAILDFDHPVNGKPAMRFIPRLLEDSVNVGSTQQALAADFSAPISLFWDREDISNAGILGAFRPKKAVNYMGLYFSEPYSPKKIPVLFTHGLMSSPATFANITNRLLADPVIRHNYQFWFFGYPSGIPWAKSAQAQRDALQYIFDEYGTPDRNSPINKMLMIGHSMGGLITRMNNSEHPWGMLEKLIKGMNNARSLTYDQVTARLEELLPSSQADLEHDKKLRESFIFNPPQQTSRIVFMATPHRGSRFADSWVGRIGQKLITLPEAILLEVVRTGTLSNNMLLLNPMKIEEELTSIRQLSPSSPFITGIQEIRPSDRIPVHSIIGDRGRNNTPNSSDGIVAYYSSHLDWAQSEKIVPAGHSVQECIPAALELRRILRLHLQDNNIPFTRQDFTAKPVLWQSNPPMKLPRTVTH
ncbi:alpha/beta hydrolase [Akkermansia sp. N21116]|uniref:esterase/lipase family protein n=1 Tax=Akkermansia sp. N21116 TaxID=3040764 RepID=UPI00244EE45D|nr:alpha/beta hydrolase [Akkermansia sp. N21116]WPX41507.1 alpha/beta hydrolase [Akkermansia sp. N21116]